ncbi:hypothetical protein LQL52_05785 [Shigella flexneri]|nr:hypothetical protein LQL52_05785 [Shigella flexneri]
MNGNTTFTVADKEYDPPYPEYVISWQTLKPVSLHVSVTLKKVTTCLQILPDRYSNPCWTHLMVQMVVCGQELPLLSLPGATMPAFTKPIRNILIFWALL